MVEAAAAIGMEKYQGQFKEDQRHGRGMCIYPDGARYTGEWAAGAVSGEGRFEHANGDVFVGTLAHGHRVRGKLTWASGDEYDGEFAAGDNRPAGEGTMHYSSVGVVHAGTWRGGRAEGAGERRELASGVLRRGAFDGERLHGEGVEVLPGGVGGRPTAERYEGTFEQGERHGRGTVQNARTEAWSGEWSSSWEGEWERGQRTRHCLRFAEKVRGTTCPERAQSVPRA
jgi:hypothetical protein